MAYCHRTPNLDHTNCPSSVECFHAPVRELTAVTPQEVAVVAHVRGWCHDSVDCGICQASFRAYELEREVRLLDSRLDRLEPA